MGRINADLNEIVGKRWTKVQLARRALTYSNRNSRITMEIFVLTDRAQIDTLLAMRAETTKQISAIVAEIERHCETEEEKGLLAAVKEERTPYIESYLRALHLLVDQNNPEAARAVMVKETTPLLLKYHAAWDNFVQFQADQVDRSAKKSAADYSAIRAFCLSMVVFAVIVTTAIGMFATRNIVREVKTRVEEREAAKAMYAEEAAARDSAEHELRHSDERMRLQAAALEAAANSIVITDKNGAIVWTNRAFSELTGYAAAEACGKNPRLLCSGKHDKAFYANLWQTITAGNTWHGEIINRRKDGSLYTEEQTITPVRSDSGENTHFVAIKQDVTARKQADAALVRAEEKYRAIFDNAVIGIIQATPEGVPLSINRALAEIMATILRSSYSRKSRTRHSYLLIPAA